MCTFRRWLQLPVLDEQEFQNDGITPGVRGRVIKCGRYLNCVYSLCSAVQRSVLSAVLLMTRVLRQGEGWIGFAGSV
jgi:hypothetical protein